MVDPGISCFTCLFRPSQRPHCCTFLVRRMVDGAMVDDQRQHGATRPNG